MSTARNWLERTLEDLRGPDLASAAAVHARAADILRPAGALERLDRIAEWVAAWQASATPVVERPAALIFAADHGVAAAGVSGYPAAVTAAMVAAYRAKRSTITAFAAVAGASVEVVDVGVGVPTGDLRVEPALSEERLGGALDAGRTAVEGLDADLVVIGEMGIGNTTAAAAVAAALYGGDSDEWVGRGTGVDDEGLARKRAAVRAGVARLGPDPEPLTVLAHVGGAELAAMAAAIAAARQRGLPVVLDGYVVTAAAAVLEVARPGALDHCIAGHVSAEPGHRRLLERLGKEPLLDLAMRLGEGSGAMVAVPVVAMACRGVTEVPTFAEWFGPGS